MAIGEQKVDLLQEAFSRFTATSLELTRGYRLLEEQVRQLKAELEAKNQALKESHREKETLRQQAERNHRLAAVGEMAARMAHELRNPLGSIELFASLLKRHLASDPEKSQWAEHLSTAVMAMNYAISNLLLFTGKPKAHFRKTDLRKMIDGVRLFFLHLIQQKKIDFIQSTENLPDAIWCDDDLLRQVFLNLILNATDAMPQGGTVKITAEPYRYEEGEQRPFDFPDAEGIIVTVADTGTGIPEGILPNIFDPFYTTKNKGTGLGLAIVHNAISAHGGTIQVQSKPGEGTTFTFILPSHKRTQGIRQEIA